MFKGSILIHIIHIAHFYLFILKCNKKRCRPKKVVKKKKTLVKN